MEPEFGASLFKNYDKYLQTLVEATHGRAKHFEILDYLVAVFDNT